MGRSRILGAWSLAMGGETDDRCVGVLSICVSFVLRGLLEATRLLLSDLFIAPAVAITAGKRLKPSRCLTWSNEASSRHRPDEVWAADIKYITDGFERVPLATEFRDITDT